MQRCFKKGTAGLPFGIGEASLAQGSGLDPVEDFGCAAPVIACKPSVPEQDKYPSRTCVDQNPTPHALPLWGNRTSLGCEYASGGNEKNLTLEVPFNSELYSRYNDGVRFGIREFHKADFETLWRIDQACFDPQLAYSQREMAYYMRHPGAFTLVAESSPEGQAIGEGSSKRERADLGSGASTRGILGFIIAEARRQSGHIITIDVVSEARRSGTGSALLQAAEDKLGESGALMVTLEVAVNNEPAIRFYKQKGYFVEKTVRGYYSNQLDALVMTKSLAGAG